MTTREQSFVKELKELFAKYGVKVSRARCYYPDDPETLYLEVDGKSDGYITLEDIAEDGIETRRW